MKSKNKVLKFCIKYLIILIIVVLIYCTALGTATILVEFFPSLDIRYTTLALYWLYAIIIKGISLLYEID